MVYFGNTLSPVAERNETGVVWTPGAPNVRQTTGDHRLRQRRWTINGDFLGIAPTGVARYAREVTTALDRLFAEGHPLTSGVALDIVAPERGREPLRLEALELRIVPEFKRPRLPQLWVQGQLPRHVRGGLVSFCNLAPVRLRRHIVCIHDLQTRLVPESYSRGFRLAHRVILPILGRSAAAITTVSEHSARQLREFCVAPGHKITVTFNGSDHAERWNARCGRLEPPLRPYALCLGRAERHKNLELLLGLAPSLDALGLDLWVVGDLNPARLQEAAPALPANVRLLGRVGDDDFRQALEGALCFLFPSRSEGFGLPAIEAMASGCPVIASNAASLPEICGDAAAFADPEDRDAWLAAITALQSDPSARARLIGKGLAQASRWRWSAVAETYLRLMHSVDAALAPARR